MSNKNHNKQGRKPLTDRVDERDAAYDLIEVIAGLLLGDKGYIRPIFKEDCDAVGIDRKFWGLLMKATLDRFQGQIIHGIRS